MAGLILPKRRITLPAKPQPGTPINRAHPLAQGLIGAIPFAEGGGAQIADAALGIVGAPGTNKPAWVATPYGSGLQLVAASTHYVDFPYARASPWRRSRGLTVMVLLRRDASGATQAIIGSGLSGWYLRVSTSPDQLQILDSQTANLLSGSGTLTVDGKFHLAGFTVGAGTSDTASATVRLWLDGKDDGSTTTTNNLTHADSGYNVCIGAERNAGDTGAPPSQEKMTGTYAGVWVWNRELRAAEVKDLAADPFAMFGVRRLFVVDGPAGGGVDATGTATAQSVPITGVAATATAGQGATGTATADSIPITGVSATGTAGTGATGTATAQAIPITGVSATGTAGTTTDATGTATAQAIPITGTTATGTAGQSATGTASAQAIPVTGTVATGSDYPPGTEARFAVGGLLARPPLLAGALAIRPAAAGGGLVARSSVLVGGLLERRSVVAGPLIERPATTTGPLIERPPAVAGELQER